MALFKKNKKNLKSVSTETKETKTVIKPQGSSVSNISPWKDRVLPAVLEFEESSFSLGEAYCTVYTIFNYAPIVDLKWLKRLTRIPNTMFSIHSEEGDANKLRENINFTVKQEQQKSLEKIDKDIAGAVEAQNKIDEALLLSQKMLAENKKIGKYTIDILVYAESRKKLEETCKEVESRFAGNGFVIRKIKHTMEDGFESMLPVLHNKYQEISSLDMPVEVFFAGLGFIPSFGINDPTGMFLGQDESGNPIFLDLWKKNNGRSNYNLVVMGKPGSGKSATVKSMLVNELAHGTRVYILDPEEEYISFADAVHGNVIDATGDGSMINPLQLTDFPEWCDDYTDEQIEQLSKTKNFKGSISEKIIKLRDWFLAYEPELKALHLNTISKALYKTYAAKGLTEGSNPRKLRNEDNPIMSDLQVQLKIALNEAQDEAERQIIKETLDYLYPIFEGEHRFMFNGYTNVDLNNKFNVFDVKKMIDGYPENLRNAQFLNILQFLWLSMTKDKSEKTILAVDEAHLFINKGSTETFKFLGTVCLRARKYEGGLWVMTQNIGHFLHREVNQYGESILNSSATRLLMKADSTDIEKMKDVFNLNEGEKDLIIKSGIGQGLLLTGDMRLYATIYIEPNVLALCQAGGGR